MAEGGFELEDMNEGYAREYDNLDRETLNNMYDELVDQLKRVGIDDPSFSDLLGRVEYIAEYRHVRDGIDRNRNQRREEVEETTFTDEVPGPFGRYDGRTVTRSILKDRRSFLSEQFGVGRAKGGTASEKLVRESRITFGKNGKPSSIVFEGEKVYITKDRGKTFDYSDNVKYVDKVDKFKRLALRVRAEYDKTLEGSIDEEVRSEGLIPNEDVTEDIASNAISEIDASIDERGGEVLEQAAYS